MSAGLLQSAQSVATSLLAHTRARLEVFGAELEEEAARLLRAVIGAVAALVLAALAAAFGALAFVLSVSAEQRVLAAAAVAGAFIALAAIAAFGVHRLAARGQPFRATLAGLERDQDAIVARATELRERFSGAGTALSWAVRLLPLYALVRRR